MPHRHEMFPLNSPLSMLFHLFYRIAIFRNRLLLKITESDNEKIVERCAYITLLEAAELHWFIAKTLLSV